MGRRVAAREEQRAPGATAARAAAAGAAPAAAVPAPRASPRRQPGSAADGRWNLFSLQRLVDERGGEHPERIEEWSSYLYFLREYAEPDGSVPAASTG